MQGEVVALSGRWPPLVRIAGVEQAGSNGSSGSVARRLATWSAHPAAILVLATLATLPLLLPPVQALIDLPGHLAQFEVAYALPHTPALARFFGFGWQPIPNLGVDLLVAGLDELIGVEPATRLVVAAIPGMTAAGLLLVARVAHGGRVPATSLMALPLCYAYPLAFGFLNSSLAMALALLLFAGWLRLTITGRAGRRLLLSLIAAPLLFFAHITGWGVFGILAGSSVLARAWRSGRRLAALATTVRACLPLAWPALLLLLWHHGERGTTFGWLSIKIKLAWTAGLLRDRWAPFDLLSAAVLLAVAALPIWRPRRFAWHPGLGLAAALLWLAGLGLPTRLLGSEYASVRLIPMACLVSLLAVAPRQPLPGWATPAALAFTALRWTGNAFALLAAGRGMAADLVALGQVLPGSRVVAFRMERCRYTWSPPRRTHLAAYATIRREAFVNDNFSREEGQLLHDQMVGDPALGPLPNATVIEHAPCRNYWGVTSIADALAQRPRSGFDYLWLIDVPPKFYPRDPALHPVWRNARTVLYRLRPPT